MKYNKNIKKLQSHKKRLCSFSYVFQRMLFTSASGCVSIIVTATTKNNKDDDKPQNPVAVVFAATAVK